MAQRVGSLIINLALESGAFKSGLSATEKQLKASAKRIAAVGNAMKGVGQTLSLAVTAPLAGLAAASIKAAIESKDALGAVNASLKSVGNAAGKTTEQLQALATSGMKQSLFDDDEILRKVTTSLLTFDKVSGQAFDRAQQAAIDLSAKFGGDLQSSALMVGKALQNPVKGLTALGKAGIDFTDQQKEQIKAMTAAGDAAGAQKIILAELEKQLAGSAAAARAADPAAAAKQAVGEAMEALGTALLPLLPPITEAITAIANAFSSMSPEAQKNAVIMLGLAAALGPVLAILGAIVTATAPFSAALALVGAAGGVMAALSAGAAGLLAVLGPLLIPLAAIAAIGAVIYANWDRIAPALAEIGARFKEAIGPEVQELVQQVGALLTKLWSGPLGTVLKEVIQLIGSLGIGFAKIFGEVIIRAVQGALIVVTGFFSFLQSTLAFIGQVLTGDFAGAWTTAKTAIVNVIHTLVNAIEAILIGRLDGIWKWVTDKIELVKAAFFGLYDAVVGNSYIPDMVDGIAAQMARLDAVMVEPAKKGTDKVKAAFKQLADDIRPLMAELFPDARALADFTKKRALLNAGIKAGGAGGYNVDQLQAAQRQLSFSSTEPSTFLEEFIAGGAEPIANMEKIRAELDKLGTAANDNQKAIDAANVKIVKSFKDMADATLNALQSLTSAIKGGGFLDILGAVIGLGLQLGSIGAFGKKIQSNINKPVPGFASGTSFAPGGMALVGERGPELVNLPRGSKVFPNGTGPGGGRQVVEIVDTTGLFRFAVNGQIMAAAPAIASAGGEVGVRRMNYRNSRRVA